MYQINIFQATNEEVTLIAELLNEAGMKSVIEDDKFFAIGYYGQHVDAINKLGFATDEDEISE